MHCKTNKEWFWKWLKSQKKKSLRRIAIHLYMFPLDCADLIWNTTKSSKVDMVQLSKGWYLTGCKRMESFINVIRNSQCWIWIQTKKNIAIPPIQKRCNFKQCTHTLSLKMHNHSSLHLSLNCLGLQIHHIRPCTVKQWACPSRCTIRWTWKWRHWSDSRRAAARPLRPHRCGPVGRRQRAFEKLNFFPAPTVQTSLLWTPSAAPPVAPRGLAEPIRCRHCSASRIRLTAPAIGCTPFWVWTK